MTELLEKALAAVRRLPDVAQNEVAHAILAFAGDPEEAEDIHPDHLPDVLRGLEQARRGEFASDQHVAAAFKRFTS